jgi:hypothetical protein
MAELFAHLFSMTYMKCPEHSSEQIRISSNEPLLLGRIQLPWSDSNFLANRDEWLLISLQLPITRVSR